MSRTLTDHQGEKRCLKISMHIARDFSPFNIEKEKRKPRWHSVCMSLYTEGFLKMINRDKEAKKVGHNYTDSFIFKLYYL